MSKIKDDRYDKVINPEEIYFPKGFVLLEAIQKDKPLIITVDSEDNPYNIDYMFIRKIHEDEETKLSEMDVILEFDGFNISSFESNKRLFSVVPINNIRIAVKPENYKFKKQTDLN